MPNNHLIDFIGFFKTKELDDGKPMPLKYGNRQVTVIDSNLVEGNAEVYLKGAVIQLAAR